MKQSIGNFLLRRLQEAAIRHIFGVPGDYSLELMSAANAQNPLPTRAATSS